MDLVIFKNIKDSRIRECFEKVFKSYPELFEHRIVVEQRKLRKTTMRAQPLMKACFTRRACKSFRIEFSNATELDDRVSMSRVPDKVLKGWFAHELGHVMDYLHRGFLEMIWFGLRYISSRRYRKKVEHKADEIAIEHGFADEILATKKYILEHSKLPERYKRRIRKYYMSIDDVHVLLEKMEEFQPEDANILDPNP